MYMYGDESDQLSMFFFSSRTFAKVKSSNKSNFRKSRNQVTSHIMSRNYAKVQLMVAQCMVMKDTNLKWNLQYVYS